MIVKIKNSEVSSWSYFECKIIHSKYAMLRDVQKEDAIIIFEKQPKILQQANGGKLKRPIFESKPVKVLSLETQKSHLRRIITDRVCYILNNEGKTIDKL